MSRRCACGCGGRCTVSEDWATEECLKRWSADRVEQLPGNTVDAHTRASGTLSIFGEIEKWIGRMGVLTWPK